MTKIPKIAVEVFRIICVDGVNPEYEAAHIMVKVICEEAAFECGCSLAENSIGGKCPFLRRLTKLSKANGRCAGKDFWNCQFRSP